MKETEPIVIVPAKQRKINRNLIDLTGKRFGRFTVKRYLGRGKWECLCECGNTRNVYGITLRGGTSNSCGCLRSELLTTHGLGESRAYQIRAAMLQRCLNPRSASFPRYGGAQTPVVVCAAWIASFENFYSDMGEPPSSEHSLDRIGNVPLYSKETCRWATRKEQMRNTRTNKFITAFGMTKCYAEWAEITGLRPRTIKNRVSYGWTPERILSEAPNGKHRNSFNPNWKLPNA